MPEHLLPPADDDPAVTRRNSRPRSLGKATYPRSMPELSLPILDLSQLDEGPEAAARFRDDLRAATHDVGFFYLTGTGISPSWKHGCTTLPVTSSLSRRPTNSRSRTSTARTSAATRGSAASAHRAGRLARADRYRPGARRRSSRPTPTFDRLVGPNLWPEAQPELQEVGAEWQRAVPTSRGGSFAHGR